MKFFTITKAKKHFSELIEKTAKGESIILTRYGRPIAKVIPMSVGIENRPKRIGFLPGEFNVPDDFNCMGQKEIAVIFKA